MDPHLRIIYPRVLAFADTVRKAAVGEPHYDRLLVVFPQQLQMERGLVRNGEDSPPKDALNALLDAIEHLLMCIEHKTDTKKAIIAFDTRRALTEALGPK